MESLDMKYEDIRYVLYSELGEFVFFEDTALISFLMTLFSAVADRRKLYLHLIASMSVVADHLANSHEEFEQSVKLTIERTRERIRREYGDLYDPNNDAAQQINYIKGASIV